METHWYIQNASGGQSIVADEVTGRTVAVIYDKRDAWEFQRMLDHWNEQEEDE